MAILSEIIVSFACFFFDIVHCGLCFFKLLKLFYLLISMSHVFINLKLLSLHEVSSLSSW